MAARDEILHNLRYTLARPDLHFPPASTPPLTPERRMTVTQVAADQRSGLALAARFGAELTKLHGTYQIVGSLPEARLALINQLLTWLEDEMAARKGAYLETAQERLVLSWSPAMLPVPALAEALRDLNFQLVTPTERATDAARAQVRYIRFGVTGVEAAFASTGSMLMVAAGAARSRAASLLPFRHIALIPFSCLLPTMEDWLHAKRASGELVDLYRNHANLTLISGPSKSADIEMNLTLGVHGPKFVHAILFEGAR